jgi:hypothetical protein
LTPTNSPTQSYQSSLFVVPDVNDNCFNQDSIATATLNFLRNSSEGFTAEEFDNITESFTTEFINQHIDTSVFEMPFDENSIPWSNNLSSNIQPYLTDIVRTIGDEASELEEQYELEEDLINNFNVNNFVNNVKTKIDLIITNVNNDASISNDEKNQVIQAASVVKILLYHVVLECYNNRDCIPETGYEKRAFLKKLFRKVVNAVATIVVRIVQNAALLVMPGAVIGMACCGQPIAGALIGASVGGFIGFIQGIDDVNNGRVICVLPCR